MDFLRLVNPGTDRGSMINAAIRAASLRYVSTGRKQIVELGAGVHYIEQKIVGRSGVRLRGVGHDRTVLVPTFGAVADADSVTNHVIGVDGTLNTAKLNTTLSAAVPYNSESVAVVNAGAIAAGDHILIEGHNDIFPGGDAIGESDGADVILSEVCQVASSYAGGLTLPLAWSLQQHHDTITVRAVTPVIAFEVADLAIHGSEDGVCTAVGIFGRYSRELVVDNVMIRGCSRSAVHMVGVLGVYITRVCSGGTNNGWIHLTSCQDGEVTGFYGVRGTPSVHASGYPRYPILLRGRCTGISVRDGVLEGAALGMYAAGGKHLEFANLLIRDIEITTAIYDRAVTSGDIQDNAHAILGWGLGFGPLNLAEFSHDVQVSNMRTENLRSPGDGEWVSDTPYRAVAIYFHDCLALLVSNVSAINRGTSGTVAAVAGVVISDVTATMTNLFVAGHQYGLITQNAQNVVRVTNYIHEGSAGSSPNSAIPIYFNHGTGQHDIHLRSVRCSNAFSALRFGASFVWDEKLVIEDLVTDYGEWDYCILADNQTGGAFNTGDVVSFDGTYQGTNRRIKAPDAGEAGYERKLAVVVSGVGGGDIGTGIQVVAPLPQRRASVMATVAVVERGDTLEYAAPRRVAVDNAAAVPLGIARNRKAAGAEGMILVGSV